MAAVIKRMPNALSKTELRIDLAAKVNRNDVRQPLTAEGRHLSSEKMCFFCAAITAIIAEGKKNNRLTHLAVRRSNERTDVIQTISRLPPPTPRPVRVPREAAIRMVIITCTIDV